MIKFSSAFNKVTLLLGFSFTTLFTSTFLIADSFALTKNIIEFNNSSYESYLLNNEKILLKSKQGELNLDNKEINLMGEVKGEFSNKGDVFKIETESLSGNLLSKSILSKEEVLFITKGFEIVSSSMEIIQRPKKELMILFNNANFSKVNPKSKINKGKANKIEFFPSKDLILMEGNAEFYEDNMKITSDEIHYDLTQDRILKSVNSKIINNL